MYLSRWADVRAIDKSGGMLTPESIRVRTRDGGDHHLSPLLNKSEAYSLIKQLADLAMRRRMEGNFVGYQQDLDALIRKSRGAPKKASFLKRDLDAKKASEEFRTAFQLPNTERLDGKVSFNDTF